MKFDIIFVTYNSKKWIDNCIKSIAKNKYDLKNVTLIFYDNNSSDETVEKLYEVKEQYQKVFNDIIIKEGKENLGFGYGNNKGAACGTSPYVFMLNIDTELEKDTLEKLSQEIKNSKEEIGMWELAQRPYEHPKYYDPITGETSWASGACMIVKRDIFEKIGGFDENIFMYCEDVEISWHLRKEGYKIKYLFNVPITHYSYTEPYSFKYTQFVYGFISNYYLRAKYGSLKNFLRGMNYLYRIVSRGENIPEEIDDNAKKKIKKEITKTLLTKTLKYLWINLTKSNNGFTPSFVKGLDYEVTKANPFYVQPEITTNPLVSIIVRTCGRPNFLRETILSIKNQTYKNIEIVIVEDGKNISEEMLNKEFGDLNINYYATGEKRGRSVAGNIAMERAKGKYLNFLDDDDVFYPDHVETLVKYLEQKQIRIAYTSSFETQVDIKDREKYQYEIKNKGLYGWGEFTKYELYKRNLFPIQSIMFDRNLFYECGGLDETIDALEDWDLWIRFSLDNYFYEIDHTTSIFRTPYNKKIASERSKFLTESLEYLNEKFKGYKPTFTVHDYYKDKGVK